MDYGNGNAALAGGGAPKDVVCADDKPADTATAKATLQAGYRGGGSDRRYLHTRDQAENLAYRIRSYWERRGFKIEVWCELDPAKQEWITRSSSIRLVVRAMTTVSGNRLVVGLCEARDRIDGATDFINQALDLRELLFMGILNLDDARDRVGDLVRDMRRI